MSLSFTGDRAETLNGIVLRAVDADGKTVAVNASHEAIQDHGLERVQNMAATKFSNGQTEMDGSISVRTGDF